METTVIPPAGNGATPGFHSHEGRKDDGAAALGLVGLLLFQQFSNEGRATQRAVFDSAIANRDAVDRFMLSAKADAERIQARIDDARLETVRQVDAMRLEMLARVNESDRLALKLADDQTQRALLDAKEEIRFMRLRSTVPATAAA